MASLQPLCSEGVAFWTSYLAGVAHGYHFFPSKESLLCSKQTSASPPGQCLLWHWMPSSSLTKRVFLELLLFRIHCYLSILCKAKVFKWISKAPVPPARQLFLTGHLSASTQPQPGQAFPALPAQHRVCLCSALSRSHQLPRSHHQSNAELVFSPHLCLCFLVPQSLPCLKWK